MKRLSIYLSYLLRHHPEDIHLDMDVHGYVSVKQLIDHINQYSQYQIDKDILDNIVANDDKKRYKYSNNQLYIKACQGHSIEWVIPELTYKNPPDKLYHGTTLSSYHKILESGYISKMKRHAVHTQADIHKAFQSAKRWHSIPVVLEIDAKKMNDEGYEFGVSDNNVWCVEKVPVKYILNVIEE
jgi:putative RNA 2'-phosphotransferase